MKQLTNAYALNNFLMMVIKSFAFLVIIPGNNNFFLLIYSLTCALSNGRSNCLSCNDSTLRSYDEISG